MMALVKFPPGVADKYHSHPKANQFIFGLSGRIEAPNGTTISTEGIFAHCQSGEKHGATKISEESVLLFYWDGPPTPQIDE